MKIAATGRAVVFGLGIEQRPGVPGSALIGYDPALPVVFGLDPTEAESAQVNRSGYLRRGIPAQKGGPFEWGHPFTAAHLVDYLQHVFRCSLGAGLTRTTHAAGIEQYDLEPVWPGIDTSFWSLAGKPPVEIWQVHGIRFSVLEIPIGTNVEIAGRLTGIAQHGTLLGPAEEAAGNTGTYTLGPHVRGLAKTPAAGPIWVRVESLAPLIFKVLQSAAEPDAAAWTAAAATFQVLLDADGNADWQNAQSSADGLDLGVWAENKDPLEINWGGAPADHADLAVGDMFSFPVTWQAPALSLLTGHQRFTSAHWRIRLRKAGTADPFVEVDAITGTVRFERPLEARFGNSRRYAHTLLPDALIRPTVQLQRDFVDRLFAERFERHDRLEMQLLFEGQQLDATHRESVTFSYPSMGITADAKPASAAGPIQETVNLVGETNDAGDPPVTVSVITSRDWTPAAA